MGYTSRTQAALGGHVGIKSSRSIELQCICCCESAAAANLRLAIDRISAFLPARRAASPARRLLALLGGLSTVGLKTEDHKQQDFKHSGVASS